MAKTAIEWTELSWNPTTGCRKISTGCEHCYAASLAGRLKAMRNPRYQKDGPDGPGFGLTLHWDKLDQPCTWRKPRKVFVNSMSDLFHKDVPQEFIQRAFATMSRCAHHQFQVLTKRPKRMSHVLSRIQPDPVPNVWLGTSVESDAYVWRVDWLRRTPASVRWLSLETLLGPMPALDLGGIDWVVVGGESGPGHRPISGEWVREIRDRCLDRGVPFFFKQWGGRTPKAGGRTLDGVVWDQYPKR